MPHDTTFFAIFGMLFYFFYSPIFWYAAVAMALWFTVPVMRVVWQTTKDLRDIPDGEDRTNEDSAEEGTDDDDAEDG